MTDYQFTEKEIATMNRFELEEYLDACKQTAEEFNCGYYSLGTSDFRRLDHQFHMVLTEIQKRNFNFKFFAVNSLKKMLDVLEKIYLLLKSFLIYELLRPSKSQTDWENFK